MTESEIRQSLNLALQAENEGRFDDAARTLQSAWQRASLSQIKLDVGLRLGRMWFYLDRLDDCEQVIEEVATLAKGMHAERLHSRAVHLLALVLRRRHRLVEALELLEANNPTTRDTATPTSEVAQWWHYRGLLVADRGKTAQGERMLFRAHQGYRELQDRQGLAEVCDSLANLLLRHGKTAVANIFASESLEQKLKLGDLYGQAISYGTLGRIATLQANYEQARAFLERDLALCRQLKATRYLGQTWNTLGQVSLREGNIPEAIACFEASLREVQHPKNDAYANIGLTWAYLLSEQLFKAEITCDAAHRATLTQPPDEAILAMLGGLRGAISWRQGNHDRGAKLLAETVEKLDRPGIHLETIPFLYELRDLNQARKNTPEAVRAMIRALHLLHECGAKRGVEDLEAWLEKVDSPSLIRLALEQHLPDFLVDEILDGRLSPPPSTVKEAVILFSDIRDYTTLTEGLDPQQVVEMLNEWFTEATRVIRRHGGVIDKFIGDAVMAVFGIPEPKEDRDPCASAVLAALDLRDELMALNLRQEALNKKSIRIGIGIDVGPVVVGFIGSYLRQSYTVIGDAVNVASRLESATKQLQTDIVISAAVQSRQSRAGVAESTYRGRIPIKGHTEVDVYEVKGRLHPSFEG